MAINVQAGTQDASSHRQKEISHERTYRPQTLYQNRDFEPSGGHADQPDSLEPATARFVPVDEKDRLMTPPKTLDTPHEIRSANTERKKRSCLMCGRHFTTTRVNRICGKCHKLINRNSYS